MFQNLASLEYAWTVRIWSGCPVTSVGLIGNPLPSTLYDAVRVNVIHKLSWNLVYPLKSVVLKYLGKADNAFHPELKHLFFVCVCVQQFPRSGCQWWQWCWGKTPIFHLPICVGGWFSGCSFALLDVQFIPLIIPVFLLSELYLSNPKSWLHSFWNPLNFYLL